MALRGGAAWGHVGAGQCAAPEDAVASEFMRFVKQQQQAKENKNMLKKEKTERKGKAKAIRECHHHNQPLPLTRLSSGQHKQVGLWACLGGHK